MKIFFVAGLIEFPVREPSEVLTMEATAVPALPVLQGVGRGLVKLKGVSALGMLHRYLPIIAVLHDGEGGG